MSGLDQSCLNYFHPTIFESILFLFLLYVAKGSSSLIHREKRTILNRNSNLAKINLAHTHLEYCRVTPKQPFTSHSGSCIRATLPDYREPPHLCSRSVATSFNKNFLSLRESGRYVHLPGRSVTRLTAYHIYGMWLVLSNA